MQTITLSTGALIQIRDALMLTPQSEVDHDWAEAYRVITEALAQEFDDREQAKRP